MPVTRASSKKTEPVKLEKTVKKQRGNVDIILMAIIALLVIFGMLMLFSASYPKSLSENQDSYYLVKQQAGNLILGLIAAVIVSQIDYKVWRLFAWPAMLVALVCLVWVFFMPEANGAQRWIYITVGGKVIQTFQPGEIAKFSIILVFALMLHGHRNHLRRFTRGVLPFILVLVVTCALLFAEPHVSGTILVGGIGLAMMYAGGVPMKWLLLIVGVVAGFALIIWNIRPSFLEHAFLRIETFRDFENADPDAARQSIQSLTAIGSGGVFGRGLGMSRQKYMYLPEMHNDYIFAILCEELGLVGAVATILLFLVLLVRCLMIARRVKDVFGSMLVVGVAVQITLQALLHMAVNANCIPATGISLPFFSYGGTALILQLVEIGIVFSVSRQADLDTREPQAEEVRDEQRSGLPAGQKTKGGG